MYKSNIYKGFVIIFVVAIGTTFSIQAQDRFTLEEAISAALEYNHAIRAEAIDVEIAGRLATRGNAGLLPEIGITVDAEQSYGSMKLVPGSFFRDLIGGGEGEQAPAIPASIRYMGVSTTSSMAGIGGQMLIYNGGRGQIRYRMLQSIHDTAGLKHRNGIEITILEITRGYAETVFLQESLRLYREIQRQGSDRYRVIREQNRYGQASDQELLQALADLKSDSTDFRDLENRFENSYRELHQKIGWDQQEKLELETEFPVSTRFELEVLIDEAGRNNTHLELSRRQMELSEYELQLSKADFFPSILASAQFGHMYEYASEGQFESREQLGFTGGVTLQVPLFQGGRRAIGLQNSRSKFQQSKIRLQEAELQLSAELENNLSRFEYLEQQLETLRDDLDVHERSYERAAHAYRQGLITGLELRNSQIGMMSAMLQISEVQLQLKMTETALIYASGQLLVMHK